MLHAVRQLTVLHLFRICLVKILHELTNLIITLIVSIHIHNMGTIFKRLTRLPHIAVYMIYRKTFSELIMLIYKYDI